VIGVELRFDCFPGVRGLDDLANAASCKVAGR
jgi:hypothetical protein